MKRNQRANLIPGNAWNKRRIKEMRLDCWWEGASLEDKQFIFEGFEKGRDAKEVAEDELKEEQELDYWWSEQHISSKKIIYDAIMKELDKEEKAPIFKGVEECLQKKLGGNNG